MHPGFWTGDVDRHPNPRALMRLSEHTAVPINRSFLTGLSAYEGYLWNTYYPKGPVSWILPVGRYGRRRLNHGQQFCRICLAEDLEPYFRRRWRLAFNVACESHGIHLDDACRVCGAPVEFHTGDFGNRLLDFECPITLCPNCGSDLRIDHVPDLLASAELVTFQAMLNKALYDGWHESLPGAWSYSFLAFDGLRYFVRLLCSHSRGGRLRSTMQKEDGRLLFDVAPQATGPVFEELRLGDRAEIINWCRTLLAAWPSEFIRHCREARVASSYIRRYGIAMPYWLNSVVQWHLYDLDYKPSDDEKEAAATWLTDHGHTVSTNAVRRLLGVSHTTRSQAVADKSLRWNPRGPSFHL